MPWWGWVIFGSFLLGSELFLVDVGFYLVFIGIAAILTGLAGLLGLGLEPWAQWLLFAGLGLVSMVFFRQRLYNMLKGSSTDYDDGLSGEVILLDESLSPGASCRQTYRGTTWTVVNRGEQAISKGDEATIDRVEGLSLIISNIVNQ
jgi:membrane protein implicated in regulation of membrane protease activity